MHQPSFGLFVKAPLLVLSLLCTLSVYGGSSRNIILSEKNNSEPETTNHVVLNTDCPPAEQTADLFKDAQITAPTSRSYTAQTDLAPVFSFSAADEEWINVNAVRDELVGNNRSFFAWVKAPASLSGSQTLFGVNTDNGRDQAFFGLTSDKNLRLNNGASFNAGRITSDAALGEGWHFVGYTYNHSTNRSRIYLDGVEVATATNNYDSESGDLFSIGQYFDRNNTDLHFDGDLTEVTIWNEELSAEEVRAAMGSKLSNAHTKYANLIAYYAPYGGCGDGTSVVVDHTGNNNPGVPFINISYDNVANIIGFNAIDWYDAVSWSKDGAVESTEADFTTTLNAGNYEFVATTDFITASDQWNVALAGTNTTEDLIADETLCTDDAISKMLTDINKVNYLDFEADNEQYITADAVIDDLVGSDRSIFLWVNKESLVPNSEAYQLFTIHGSDGLSDIARFYISGNEELGITSNGTNFFTDNIPLDTWKHVGYTYDATNQETKIYIDGAVVRTISNVEMSITSGAIATIGMRYGEDGPTHFLDGKMAEITVWDKALTEEEVTAIKASAPAQNAANLVAAYGTFPSIVDNRLYDITGNANHGLANDAEIFVLTEEATIPEYNASNNYTFSWKKEGIEFDTDATGNINVEEGTTNYSVTYGTPFFQKMEEFAISYTNLLPTQPVSQTNGALGSVTFEVSEIAGASYQWYERKEAWTSTVEGENGFPQNTGVKSVFANMDHIFVGSSSGGLAISSDGGQTWISPVPGQNGYPSGSIHASSVYFDDGKLYVATDEGLTISSDNGATWSGDHGFPFNPQYTGIFAEGDNIYLTTFGSGLYISKNGGNGFTTVTSGQNGFANSNDVRDVHASGSNVYVATDGGLSISNNEGATWNTVDFGQDGFANGNAIISVFADGNKIYAAVSGGLSISEDNGNTWSTTTSGQNGFADTEFVRSVFADGDKVYVGTTKGLSISSDGGATWSTSTSGDNGLGGSYVTSIHVANGKIYAGLDNDILSISQDRLLLSDDSNESANNQIQGATSHQLTINNLSLDKNEAEFFVVVTKGECSQSSNDVGLTVLDVPILTSIDPASGSTDVAIDNKITLTFSRDIFPATNAGNMVRLVDEDGTEITNLTVTRVSPLTNLELTINQDLDYATRYSLLMDEGFVVDLTDGAKAVLAVTDLDAFSFTTVCETLVTTQPTDQTGFVSGSATFSVPEVSGATYKWYKSTGDLWETTTSGQNGFAGSNTINEISAAGDKIIVGTYAGVSISTDGGEIWTTTIEGQNGFANSPTVRSVYTDGDKLYAGTSSGLSISKDGGASWVTTTGGENGFSASKSVYSVYAEGDNVYATTVTSDAYGSFSKSTDGGLTWTTTLSGQNGLATSENYFAVFAEGNKIYVGAHPGGLSISNDGGASWTTTTGGENGFSNNFVYDVYADGDMVYVATTGGLCISSDGGVNWSTITSGQNGFANSNLAISVYAEGNSIYVGTETGGISISEDGGATWETITSGQNGFASDNVKSVVPIGNQVFAATNAGLSTLVGNEALETSADNSADNAISGADTRELTISNLTTAADQTEYVVEVTLGDCEEFSNEATLTLTEGPVIASTNPANNATDVAISINPSFTFDRAISRGSGNIRILKSEDDSEVVVKTIGSVRLTGETVTIDKFSPLDYGTQYYINMDAGIVVDAGSSGNPAITDKTTWTFTTECPVLFPTQPTASQGVAGQSLTITAPLRSGATYEWRVVTSGIFSGVLSDEAGVRSGTNTNVLTLENLSVSDNDKIYVVDIILGNCSERSEQIQLSVSEAPDYAVESFTPAIEATGISTNINANGIANAFSVTFNHPMQLYFGNTLFLNTASDNSQVASTSISNSNLVNNSKTLQFSFLDQDNNPFILEPNTEYFITTGGGILESTLSGDVFNITEPSWNFITEANTPGENIITEFSPEPGSSTFDVSVPNRLTITTSENLATDPEPQGSVKIFRAADDVMVLEFTYEGVDDTEAADYPDGGDEIRLDVEPGELQPGTEYYVLIDDGFIVSEDQGLYHIGISDKTTWNFTTASTIETFSQVAVFPQSGSTRIPLNISEYTANLVTYGYYLLFGNAIAPGVGGNIGLYNASDNSLVLEINTDNEPIIVNQGNNTQLGTAYIDDANGGSSNALFINGDVSLEPSTEYYWLLDEGIVVDADNGNPFAGISSNTSWSFTTLDRIDISSVIPANNAENVSVTTTLFIEFDQEIFPGSGSLEVRRASDDQLFNSFNFSGSQISWSNNELTLTFGDAVLDFDTEYYVLMSDNFVSGSGQPVFNGISDKTTWTFTTADNAPSTFSEAQFYPLKDQINVPLNINELDFNDVISNIPSDVVLGHFLAFDKDLAAGSGGNLSLYSAGDNTLVYEINTTIDPIAIASSVEGLNQNKVTIFNLFGVNFVLINDDFELEPNTQYYWLADAGIVTDAQTGDLFEGISDPTTWSFTTIDVPEEASIVSTSPVNNSTDVAIDVNLEITFSENVTAETGNVTIYDDADNVVDEFEATALSISGAKVTINPGSDLAYNSTYYVLIDAAAFQTNQGIAFSGISDKNTFTFTTIAKPNTAPVASGVDFSGTLEVNLELSGTYTFADEDTDAESGSTFQWYVADNGSGANQTVISGATGLTYTITDDESGKYLAFGVTPNDGSDAGAEVLSDYQGPVSPAVVPTIVSNIPVDGANDVAKDAELTLTLSETVTKGTGNIVLTPVSGTAHVIDVTSTEVNASGAVVTIIPNSDLIEGQFYTVTFDASAFVDTDGNNSAGLTNQTDWNFTVKEANVAPVANGVTLKKSLVVDGVLQGSYTYTDANDDAESGTTFKWYRSDDVSGTNKVEIAGALGQDYTIVNDDNAKYISFEVTPNDGALSGIATESALFGPIVINDGVTNIPPAFTSDALTTIKDNETYSYTVTYEDLNSDVPTLTKTIGPDWLSVSGFALSGDPTAANIGDHNVLLTLNDQNGGTVTQEFTITVVQSNTAPSLEGVEIRGINTIDMEMRASYNFIDAEDDADNSTFKWYRADDNTGTNEEVIANASGSSYTLMPADAGKYISVEVTPNDGKTDGTAVQSGYSQEIKKIVFSELYLAPFTKTYGDQEVVLSPTTKSSGEITYTINQAPEGTSIAGNVLTLGDAGFIFMTITQAEDEKYLSATTQVGITVQKRTIEITAMDAGKKYGSEDPNLTYSVLSGEIVSGDEVVVVSRDAGEDVGTYAITLTDGVEANNYQINKTNGTFTISKKALIVEADATSKVYGEVDPEFTYRIISGELLPGDVLNGSLTREQGSDVGTYAIQNSLFSGNYEITFASANLTITKKELTATADDKERNEKLENPELTITYDGFVLGDDATVLDNPPTIATTATTDSDPGIYDIILTGGSDNNYTLSLFNGTLTINNVNDAPVVANAIADITVGEGFGSNTVDLTDVFMDTDGDALTYSVSSSDESVATVTVTGNTLTYTEVGNGNTSITVTADDSNGGSETDEFTLTINAAPANSAPTLANDIANQIVDEGFGTIVIDLSDVFFDNEGDALTFTATSYATDIVEVGIDNSISELTITEVGIGRAFIIITANDGNGGTDVVSFSVTVNEVNEAPIVANAMQDIVIDEGFNPLVIDLNEVFTDNDGDALNYSVTSSGSDVVSTAIDISIGTLTITGVNPGDAIITITAEDPDGETAIDEFAITIVNVNDAPIVANPVADQSYEEGFETAVISLSDVFTDRDGDELSISAATDNDDVIELSYNVIDGTLTIFEVKPGVATITITADDGNGGSVSATFTVVVNNINDAPVVNIPVADQVFDEGFESVTIDLSAVFTDEDGDALTIIGSVDLPEIVTVEVDENSTILTILETGLGVATITLSAHDGNGESISDEFTVTVNEVNKAPIVANALADSEFDEGFQEAVIDISTVFTDEDNDQLSFAVGIDNADVVSVSLNASSDALIISEISPGTVVVSITADDGKGGVVTDNFTVVVIDINEAPIVMNPIADQSLDESFGSFSVSIADLFADNDGDLLTIVASSSNTAVATATVLNQAVIIEEVSLGQTLITLTANDGRGGIVSSEFTVFINSVSVPNEPEMPRGISPNGDGVNDQWVIPNIENFPNNRVNIFDRGGKLVFSIDGYNNSTNAFEGFVNVSGAFNGANGLPDGVYYYVIDIGNGEVRKGTIIIKQ